MLLLATNLIIYEFRLKTGANFEPSFVNVYEITVINLN